MNATDLLTADQAAQQLGVNRRTVTKWADDGKLAEALRLPGPTGARLFRASDVDTLAAERATSEATS